MAISLTAREADAPLSEMNTTPLIDVMLVLLIMFIVTLPLMTHSVKIEMPAAAPVTRERPVIALGIDFDGTIVWNGKIVPSLSELENRLRAEARAATPAELQVTADKRARYDTVAKVLAIAQRSGLQRIGIAGND